VEYCLTGELLCEDDVRDEKEHCEPVIEKMPRFYWTK
jgi:hypothetical protein